MAKLKKLENTQHDDSLISAIHRLSTIWDAYIVSEGVEKHLSYHHWALYYCEASSHLLSFCEKYQKAKGDQEKQLGIINDINKRHLPTKSRRNRDFWSVIISQRIANFIATIEKTHKKLEFTIQVINDQICFYENGYQFRGLSDQEWMKFIVKKVAPSCSVPPEIYVGKKNQEYISEAVGITLKNDNRSPSPIVAFKGNYTLILTKVYSASV
ncbi:MAG: hypothetical protein OXE77_08945 [Flavobacteriaceae bacterium]|nr:hypothetical protein [Flavobacteriaceae bacterium]MCY4268514.1 hypothetical protein [Flavobacteriaceae bacterium]